MRETSATFTTPEIPNRDFADYNPGKGLASIRDNVLYLRDTYAATKIKRIDGPAGVQFAVTGPRADIARLATLYGA